MSKRLLFTLVLLIAAVIGTSAISQGASERELTWEYHVLPGSALYARNASETLNALGADGWFLVRRQLQDGTLLFTRQVGEVVDALEYLMISRNDWIQTVADKAVNGNDIEAEQEYLNDLGLDGWILNRASDSLIFVREAQNAPAREYHVMNTREWLERENVNWVPPPAMQDLLNDWGSDGWMILRFFLPVTPNPSLVLTRAIEQSEQQIEYRLIDRSDWRPPIRVTASRTDDPYLQALQAEEDRLNELEKEGWRLVEYALTAANSLVFRQIQDGDSQLEYLIVSGPEWDEMVDKIIDEDNTLQAYSEVLNEFGSQGWKIENMTPTTGALVFKRLVSP